MLFKVVDDWKQNLHPDDEVRMNELLRNVTKHRTAYRSSKDVKTAQLWCALLELDKKNQDLTDDFRKLAMIIEGFSDVLRRAERGDSRSRDSCRCECKNESRCCEENYDRSYDVPRHVRDRKLLESLEKF